MAINILQHSIEECNSILKTLESKWNYNKMNNHECLYKICMYIFGIKYIFDGDMDLKSKFKVIYMYMNKESVNIRNLTDKCCKCQYYNDIDDEQMLEYKNKLLSSYSLFCKEMAKIDIDDK